MIDWTATSISKSEGNVFIACEDGELASAVFELICTLAEMGVQLTPTRVCSGCSTQCEGCRKTSA